MIVQPLLPFRKHLSSQVLASEMGCQRIYDYQANVVVFDYLVRFFEKKHLMIRVVRLRIDNLLGGLRRLHPRRLCHSHDPLWTKSLLRIQVQRSTVEATLVHGQLNINRKLVAQDGLSDPVLTVNLRYGLSLKATANELIEGLAACR